MLDSSAQPMPLRRTENVTVQHVGEETLLYDERTHQAFCLNLTTALVWKSCDGTRTPTALAALLFPGADSLTGEAVVRFALSRLSKDHLVEGYVDAGLAGVSRRAMLVKGGASLALMLPAIAMIAAPKAAQAYSGCFDCSNASAATQRRRKLAVD